MKDNLFEMLLNLFEKTLAQLKKNNESVNDHPLDQENKSEEKGSHGTDGKISVIKAANSHSIRVFTDLEKIKLTKASYQFLMRVVAWGVLSPEALEAVLNQLLFSDARFVSLLETKWTIRQTLSSSLEPDQLAFLDLILYHKEDELSLH